MNQKYIRSQTISVESEIENPNIPFTHVDIAQQKVSNDENLYNYICSVKQ